MARLPYPLGLVETVGGVVFGNEKTNRDVNLIAVRLGKNTPGQGDDLLYACWREQPGGSWTIRCWPCETEPGIPHLTKPMNSKGTAILAPGQYRKSWAAGNHHGRRALVQVRPINVFRDHDRDTLVEIDPRSLDNGMFGVNIHDVKRYDELAGCVGLLTPHMTELLQIYDMTASLYGPEITLTLVEAA